MTTCTPRLEIYPERIAGNARALIAECAAHGIQVAAVSKVMQAHPVVLEAFADAEVAMVADSRIANLVRVTEFGLRAPRLLLRPPSPSEASRAVRWADYSLNSSAETVAALSRAAVEQKTRHAVIMMVDVGDLREGIWPDRVIDEVAKAASLPQIELAGLGTNLACYGGVLPSAEKMAMLVDLREQCRQATGLSLDLLSGGNSANLNLLASGAMPDEINHLRLGESIILGRETLDRKPWRGTRQDAVRVVAEVIELERKPSVPVGEVGQDAFGQYPVVVDRGTRWRAICNLGRQDASPDGLTPQDPGIIVVGASSDHLILDVTDASSEVRLGSELSFSPNYAALLAASTSPYVHKQAVRAC
ncbi:alanine/ornithine racemase family PLP-dependent enzyme [Propionimicrobium sp. PCR01-08-3]|uniref:alanine/ornithine racemase family PLP-dependent enzyme n=1 Tax=Propionimicrobium sp. PCR01-08-3 TaxID=3052086 RepID=UPI00255CA9F6|nr:alanine/ornithine racemase family PLP-dependent enzyme [Propionimicrobium sp. PCR01-08-3]WIY82700.1 alanine/ornithine racemase family PLP-dependent enzyme [Propionimicrobium sp. PCR01-08-3]